MRDTAERVSREFFGSRGRVRRCGTRDRPSSSDRRDGRPRPSPRRRGVRVIPPSAGPAGRCRRARASRRGRGRGSGSRRGRVGCRGPGRTRWRSVHSGGGPECPGQAFRGSLPDGPGYAAPMNGRPLPSDVRCSSYSPCGGSGRSDGLVWREGILAGLGGVLGIGPGGGLPVCLGWAIEVAPVGTAAWRGGLVRRRDTWRGAPEACVTPRSGCHETHRGAAVTRLYAGTKTRGDRFRRLARPANLRSSNDAIRS